MAAPAALCLVLAAALLAVQLPLAAAHAGHFHPWPIQAVNPADGTAVLVGTCSKWQRVPSTIAPVASSIVDASRAATSTNGNVSITGTVKLWQYLLQNCSGVYTASMEFDLLFRYVDGSALRRVPIGGFTRTGSCAQGGGDIYLLDPAEGQVDENQLFVSRANTRPNGTFHGTTPNSGNLTTGPPNGVRSIVLSNNATGDVYGCCDFVIPSPGADYSAQLVGKGVPCDAAAVEETVHSLSEGDSAAPATAAAVTQAPAPAAAAGGAAGAPEASGGVAAAASAGVAAVAAVAALLLA